MLLIRAIVAGVIGALCYYFGYRHGCRTNGDAAEMLEKAMETRVGSMKMLEDAKRILDESSEMIAQQRADNQRFYEEVNAKIKLLQHMEGSEGTDG